MHSNHRHDASASRDRLSAAAAGSLTFQPVLSQDIGGQGAPAAVSHSAVTA